MKKKKPVVVGMCSNITRNIVPTSILVIEPATANTEPVMAGMCSNVTSNVVPLPGNRALVIKLDWSGNVDQGQDGTGRDGTGLTDTCYVHGKGVCTLPRPKNRSVRPAQ